MLFKQIDNWYWESAEGYRISRAVIDGVEKFSAWAPETQKTTAGKMFTQYRLLLVSLTFKASKMKCESYEHGKIQAELLRQSLRKGYKNGKTD